METHSPVLTRVPIAGHSLHRWLVGIPVLLYVSTVGFFALYAYDQSLMWLRDGIVTNLLAVLAAVVVAVPGLLDALAIPPKHEARRVAFAHGSLMAIVLGLFATNVVMHHRVLASALKGSIALQRGLDGTVPLAITGVALGLAICGGALGLLLAHAYHVGDTAPGDGRPPTVIQPRTH